MAQNTQSEMSNDTKNIITVLLLIFVYPVGLIIMWVWHMWSNRVRLLITFWWLILIVAPFLIYFVVNVIHSLLFGLPPQH